MSILTCLSVVHPWHCDGMGHMNVRHYAAMFDDASFHLLGIIAGDGRPGHGWADIRCETDYRHETPSGTLISIETTLVSLGRSSLAYRHVLSDRISRKVHAEALVKTVRFDLDARRSAPLAPDERQRAEALLATAGQASADSRQRIDE
jgi:acyl-CoA thioester hydrolase